MKSHLDLSQRTQWSGEANESLKLCNWALPCAPDGNAGLIRGTGCYRKSYGHLCSRRTQNPGSRCHRHVRSSPLTQNSRMWAEIQALTWSRCNERLGLWGITNRVWHLLLLTGLLRLMLFFCSQASTVQQQWKITRELWTLSTAHD